MAAPVRPMVRQQGEEEIKLLLQLKLSSAFQSLVALLKNIQPVVGGWLGTAPRLAFSNASSPFSPTSHSSLDLGEKGERGTILTCTEGSSSMLVSPLSEPACTLGNLLPSPHAQAQTCPRNPHDNLRLVRRLKAPTLDIVERGLDMISVTSIMKT